MPLVIFEGPEAAGKSTLIDLLLDQWGHPYRFRAWGPRTSWLEYCQPLFDDLQSCREDPRLLVVWSRSWLSRAVYNNLLEQGRPVPRPIITELDSTVIREHGLLLLVSSPENVLLQRRLERLAQPGSKPDHPLDPGKELSEFYRQNRSRKWRMISGVKPPEDSVQQIMSLILERNPDSRMPVIEEEPIEASV